MLLLVLLVKLFPLLKLGKIYLKEKRLIVLSHIMFVYLRLIAKGACVPVQHFKACDVENKQTNKQTLDCFVCHCLIV